MNIHFVTVATKQDLFMPYLLMSCKRHGIKMNVLGEGQAWKGFLWRLTLIKEFLETKPASDVVCFVDAYDVLVNASYEKIKSTYLQLEKELNKQFIIGKDCDNKVRDLLEPIGMWGYRSCNATYINAGNYIGRVSVVKHVIGRLCSLNKDCKIHADDQKAFIEICRKDTAFFNEHIAIDTMRTMFHVDCYTSTRAPTACIVHYASSANMFPLLIQQGYPVDPRYESYVTTKLTSDRRTKALLHAHVRVMILLVLTAVALVLLSWWLKSKPSRRKKV